MNSPGRAASFPGHSITPSMANDQLLRLSGAACGYGRTVTMLNKRTGNSVFGMA